MTPLTTLAREAGLTDLHRIADDRVFIRKVYELARALEHDPATPARTRIAIDAYAVEALFILASEPDRGARP
jgi:hypothetical protein